MSISKFSPLSRAVHEATTTASEPWPTVTKGGLVARLAPLLLILVAAPAFAQMSAGVRLEVGTSLPTVSGGRFLDYESRPVVGVTGFAEVPVAGILDLVVEGGYAQAATYEEISATTTSPGTVYSFRTRAHFVSFAPAVRLSVGRGVRPYLTAGPRIDTKLVEIGDVDSSGPGADLSVADLYAPIMGGFTVGLGAATGPAFGSRGLRADVRAFALNGASANEGGASIGQAGVEVRLGVVL